MESRKPSRADLQALDATAAAGYHVTARKLERWRQAGIIPRPQRRALGQGKGSESSYDDETLRHIVESARRAGCFDSLAKVALCLFAEGYPIVESVVRGSYDAYFQHLRDFFTDLAGSTDPFEQADAFACKALESDQRGSSINGHKRASRRAFDATPDDELTDSVTGTVTARRWITQSAFANLVTVAFYGKPYTNEGQLHLLRQISHLEDTPAPFAGADVANIDPDKMKACLTDLCAPGLQRLAETAPWEDLVTGSRLFQALVNSIGQSLASLDVVPEQALLWPLICLAIQNSEAGL